MFAAKSLVFLLAASIASFSTLSGCAAEAGDDESEDHEDEPVGESSDELRSAVSCQERSDTAYKAGTPYAIQVIHVGGKPTTKTTGHAFLKMQAAAHADGVRLSLTSGFRTMAEQKRLYNCYTSKRCNNGNLAARPGYSNHQNGLALDISTSSWLTRNAKRFGFVRTVSKESWHYEYRGKDPGGPCSRGTAEAATVGADPDEDDKSETTTAPAEPTPAAGGLTWVAPAQDSTRANGFVVKSHTNRPGIVKVVYSQGTYDFGTSTNATDDFSLSYTFKYMGDKTLTAKGYNASGALLAEDHVDFTLTP